MSSATTTSDAIDGANDHNVDNRIIPKTGLSSGKGDDAAQGPQTDELGFVDDRKAEEEYRQLSSRHIDLVGDYAGSELFFVEGDSMLLRCFSDSKLHLEHDFQLLHAVYSVEKFLARMLQRKCNFLIVFFRANRSLCVPPTVDAPEHYYLARAAIIRHLQVNADFAKTGIAVHTFESCHSEDFTAFLKEKAPYFIMAHDGAMTQAGHGQTAVDRPHVRAQQLALRKMILSFIQQKFNVALINYVEWRDTKIMTMVLEPRTWSALQPQWEPEQTATSPTSSSHAEMQTLHGISTDLTESQILSAIVISRMISKSDPSSESASLHLAFLRHQAMLAHTPLATRNLSSTQVDPSMRKYLLDFSLHAEEVLMHESWKTTAQLAGVCDVYDLLNARLLLHALAPSTAIDKECANTLHSLVNATNLLIDDKKRHLVLNQDMTSVSKNQIPSHLPAGTGNDVSILPFSNTVFDPHLESIRIKVDTREAEHQGGETQRVFRDLSHWHNTKSLIVKTPAPEAADPRKAKKLQRKNDRFMAEMQKYAASLTNSIGGMLLTETITTGNAEQNHSLAVKKTSARSEGVPDVSVKRDASSKKAGGAKTAHKNVAKQVRNDKLRIDAEKRNAQYTDSTLNSWRSFRQDVDKSQQPEERYEKVRRYKNALKTDQSSIIAGDCELYMLHCLITMWAQYCRDQSKSEGLHIVALIWSHVLNLSQLDALPSSVQQALDTIVKTLKLPFSAKVETPTGPGRDLSFDFQLPKTAEGLGLIQDPINFQLMEAGPYLERNFDSQPDARVKFTPDEWQRRVLDSVDANESVFVVAPTSAGKTFISFYAMRRVLQADDDGILVYVAPTKALVNQLAAEIQARYSKSFRYPGKSVWAIHTRDYRINNPAGCQVLVTVPHILQIMLMSGSNAKSWSSRVKCIIFDEIHSIGNAEDGVVWEQLILMAPCPIIALSATVGNPHEFYSWMADTQKAIGNKLTFVQHPHRYSDLRKYYYVAPEQFEFTGIPSKKAFGSLGLEKTPEFRYIHPIVSLVDRSRGIPDDLALEPRDCFILWEAMVKVQTATHPISEDLSPQASLPEIVAKVDVLAWEKELKKVVMHWLQDDSSPYGALIELLEQGFRPEERELSEERPKDRESVSNFKDTSSVLKSILPLLCSLQEQNALPAICFNFDRVYCEAMCKSLLSQLEEAEVKSEKSGPKWETKLENWEKWKTAAQLSKTKEKKERNLGGDKDEKMSKAEMSREAANLNDTRWATFDPEAPLPGYSFADFTRFQLSELEETTRDLRYRGVEESFIRALTRGIAVHHAGMNRKYRQAVEMLFRRGFLRVVIATGTLALGINMPCKTVVFSGDSIYLTALNFRQCAGRAGRRGFDLLGNIVFHGLTQQKACRLISSRLPDLNGHFPITTTLVLRLFTLLNDSNYDRYAVNSINALLSQPRMHMGGRSFKDQTMHHLRFSIEYLRRQQLLDAKGTPLNFAGLVSHLYFTENSAFAFHALMKGGYFHHICTKMATNSKDTLEELMLVMAHLFNRTPCQQVDAQFRETVAKLSSSIVFLPSLPEPAVALLKVHNNETLRVYCSYVSTFIDQHLKTADDTLPLSKIQIGGDETRETKAFASSSAPTHIRSPFVALSGWDDTFDSVHDLCDTVRDGVFLEEAVVPSMAIHTGETDWPLNAWLLDFYKHGDVYALEKANGIRRSDVWFMLKDFSLVLATIITSLRNTLKPGQSSDMDFIDLQGSIDLQQQEVEDSKSANGDDDQQSELSVPQTVDSGVVLPQNTIATKTEKKKKAKKVKVADNWDDEDEDEDDGEENGDSENWEKDAASDEENTAGYGDRSSSGFTGDGGSLVDVLRMFEALNEGFTAKFHAIFA